MRARLYHGGAAFRLRAKPQRPEAALQRKVAAMLRAYLPEHVWWTCSLSGITLTPAVAGQAKAAGMNRGAPDLSFIWPDGSTTYIELKAEDGTLTTEQALLGRVLGADMRVCRSWEQTRDALANWMTRHGLRFLTERESLQREAERRRAA